MADPLPPPGIICTPDEYARSQNATPDGTAIYCLTRGQSIGFILTIEAGLLSLATVLLVFALIIRNIDRYRRNFRSGMWKLIQEPSDLYMLSLFIFDLIQALGAIADLKWVVEGKVQVGAFCSAQGALKQLGETGVALTTLVIAIHTFVAVWWSKGLHSLLAARIVVGTIWLFVGLLVVVGTATHSNKSTLYESPTQYWCWIGESYKKTRIFGEYLWLWLTLALSFVAYIPLFFWSRGNITIDKEVWWKFYVHTNCNADLNDPQGARRRSMNLIAYPLVYSVLVLPLSVVRWIGFQQEAHSENHIPSAATISVVTVFGLSGAVNVLLFLITRSDLLLFARPSVGVQFNQAQVDEQHTPLAEVGALGRLPYPSDGTWNPNPVPYDIHVDNDKEDEDSV